MMKASEEIQPITFSLSLSQEEIPLLKNGVSSQQTNSNKNKKKINIVETQEEQDVKPLHKFQIARLQHKFLILIMALLEMRDLKDSEIIMKRIIIALPKELVEHKFTNIYLQYRNLYDKNYIIQAFGHVTLVFF